MIVTQYRKWLDSSTLAKTITCITLVSAVLYFNKTSKDYYYHCRAIKITHHPEVHKAMSLIKFEPVMKDSVVNNTPLPPTLKKDCAVTIEIGKEFAGIVPSKIAGQIVKVLRFLSVKKGRARIHYEGDKLKFVGLLEGGKYKESAISYKNGWYTKNGTQIDVSYKIPKYVELVKSNNPTKTPRISSGYGYRIHPFYKVKKFHHGVDIGAPLKSQVVAALPGKISKVAYSSSYGNYIDINHENNLMTRYAHLHSIHPKISIDKPVTQNMVIGYLGRTGIGVTGPHLHFEVRTNGKSINPASAKPIRLRLKGQELASLRKLCMGYEKALDLTYIREINPKATSVNMVNKVVNKADINKMTTNDSEAVDQSGVISHLRHVGKVHTSTRPDKFFGKYSGMLRKAIMK